MRQTVLLRDKRCVAALVDPAAGVCFDEWGHECSPWDMSRLEADYVRHGAIGARHVLPEDHIALCAGHHRGTGPQAGRIWATSHRRELRDRLAGVRR